MRIQRSVWVATTAAALLGVLGCANHPLIASNSTHSGTKFGTFGISGKGNNVTIDKDSYLSVLSILGDGNSVNVEDGADVFKIEICGHDNTVSIPWYLVYRDKIWGHGNQIIPRPKPSSYDGAVTYESYPMPASAPSSP